MRKLKLRSCKLINSTLATRLMALFSVVRDNHPKQLIFYFGDALGNMEVADAPDDFGATVSDEQLDESYVELCIFAP